MFYIQLFYNNDIEVLGNCDGQGFNGYYKTVRNLIKYCKLESRLRASREFYKDPAMYYTISQGHESDRYKDNAFRLIKTIGR